MSFTASDLSLAVDRWAYDGTAEADFVAPLHQFVYHLPGSSYDGELVEVSWQGRTYCSPLREHCALLLPRGQRWICKHKGKADLRLLICALENDTFQNVLGDRVGEFDLRPDLGPSAIAPGLLERFEAVCLRSEDFPRAYTDALTAVLVFEVFRAYATKPFPPDPSVNVGKSRLKLVLDYIEDALGQDMSLSELASLVGLSISHFSGFFKSSLGVAPYRYILQRRINRAQGMLRTSDLTVTAIATLVGFSSPSRFAQVFARETGTTPSAYRLQHQR